MKSPPAGTYLATTNGDLIFLPPAIAEFVRDSGWTDLLAAISGDETVTVYPMPYPGIDQQSGFRTRLARDGSVAIGEANRKAVALSGQGVMVRVEQDVVRIYLRRVFQTLGFRPL